jgi:hypothetical protein
LITEGKTSLGRPRHRRVADIKMDVREIKWDQSAQDWDQWRAFVNTVMNLWGP